MIGRRVDHVLARGPARARAGRLALLALGLAGCLAAGCGPVGFEEGGRGEGPGHREQPLALRPEQELALGRKAYAEILRNADVVRRGPEVERTREVGERIARTTEIKPLLREINLHLENYRFEWEYTVIADKHINAFCLPGGKIGVYTGLFKVVQNDDQLATVLSHEIAHALAHHASERIARERMEAAGLLKLAYNRQQESEADHVGIFLMTFAGYDPRQAVVFWRRMKAISDQRGYMPEILSDHPSDARRIGQIEQWVPLALGAKKAYDEGRIAPDARR